MTKQSWIFLFFIAVFADIAGGLVKIQLSEYIFKPFIIIALGGYFVAETTFTPSPLKKWIGFALFFSWVGDILLLFQQDRPIFFLLGLSSFLIAHISYIVFFHEIRVKEHVKPKIWPVLIVAAYYFGLMVLLSPYLRDMKVPVRIYGIVISIMFMMAIHMVYIREKAAGYWMMIGALLFVTSDSALAINRFYSPFGMANPVIILSYGLAQLLIVSGAIKYITSEFKE